LTLTVTMKSLCKNFKRSITRMHILMSALARELKTKFWLNSWKHFSNIITILPRLLATRWSHLTNSLSITIIFHAISKTTITLTWWLLMLGDCQAIQTDLKTCLTQEFLKRSITLVPEKLTDKTTTETSLELTRLLLLASKTAPLGKAPPNLSSQECRDKASKTTKSTTPVSSTLTTS